MITNLHSDARDERAVTNLIDTVEQDIGPLAITAFNVGGNVRFGITETTVRVYRKVWELCAFAGFLVGHEAAKRMLTRGSGTILFTGATASLCGADGYAAFAGGKLRCVPLLRAWRASLGRRAFMSVTS